LDLIPKVLVSGVFTPPPDVPGGPQVSVDRLNRIWGEVTQTFPYRQLLIAADGSGAQLLGASQDEAVVIQPPLLQVRDPIQLDPQKSAEKAEAIFKIIARHLGIEQFFNFAVRNVSHAPAPSRDARGFLLHTLLRKTEDDLGDLAGGGSIWAGLKFVVMQGSVQYTLVIEPLQRDETFLFIDLDAQFPGPASLDSVAQCAGDAHDYLRRAVSSYLDKQV
jgi:hypothetical protein